MTTFKTGNPVPSSAAKDLYDNAENLDQAINGQQPVWIDRLGNHRTSIAGGVAAFDQAIGQVQDDAQRVLSSLGYLPPIPYEAGILIDSTRITVAHDGTVYAPVVEQIPFTTDDEFDVLQWRVVQGITSDDLPLFVRNRLLSNLSLYVRVDGSDANDGRSDTASGAFASVQRAIDLVLASVDLNNYSVTINVGSGAYGAGVLLTSPWVGEGAVYLVGNVADPSLVEIHATGDCVSLGNGARLDVRGFKLSSDAGRGLIAQTGATITVGPMEYASCPLGSHIEIGTGGVIVLGSDYRVSGGGSSHLHAASEGQILAAPITATVVGTPHFEAYFAGAAQGSVVVKNVIFVGAATGARYLAHKGGVIETHPAFSPALPGDIEGRTAWGGAYIGSNSEPFRVQVFPGASAAMDFQAFDGATQLFRTILSLVTDPSGTGRGYLFCNGPGSYMSELCHFGTSQHVLMGNTVDGISTMPGGETSHSVTDKVARYTRRQGSAGMVEQFWHGAIPSGSISVDSGATAFVTTSDEELKDFAEANYQPDWIVFVGELVKEYTFNHLPEGSFNPVRKGLSAQKLSVFSPNAVCKGQGRPGDEDFIPWGVDHSMLVPELIQEVYAQRQTIDELTAMVASLVESAEGS